ncbi:MAG: hypothetical protein AB7U43_05330 [Desulfobacter sp.]
MKLETRDRKQEGEAPAASGFTLHFWCFQFHCLLWAWGPSPLLRLNGEEKIQAIVPNGPEKSTHDYLLGLNPL